MARPIRETPVLTGDDAVRFMLEAQRVENMSKEERHQNWTNLMAGYQEATRYIKICI